MRESLGMRRWAVLAVLLALVGCSPLWAINALTDRSRHSAVRDIAFGDAPRLKLDVYTPRAAFGAPVVVFFYGGGWRSGDKADYEFLAEALTALGAVAVVPDYRVYPQARFPDFVEDGARALAWARRHIAGYGGDPRRVFVMGHSAGAHIAALLALDARYLAAEGIPRGWLRGMIGLAGLYDFQPLETRRLREIFAAAPDPEATQPITFAGADGPPLLLMTGDHDRLVETGNSRRLAERVRERGGSAEWRVYPGLGHFNIVSALWSPRRAAAPVHADIKAFLDAHAAGATAAPPPPVP
ncbi:MAG TPA: alpha/beta hydrolase [Acidiferrobacterales bacterium]